MFSRIHIFEFHYLILTYINLRNTDQAGDILTQIELMLQKDANLTNYFTIEYRAQERKLLKLKYPQIGDTTFTSLAKKMSPLMLAVINNDQRLTALLLKYGASVGALDAKEKSVLDYVPDDFDPYLTHLMISRHANRNVQGLIVGCGHGLGACNIDEDGKDTWDASHAHIHKHEDFLTVGQSSADYQCCFQLLANNTDFIAKYKSKLKLIIFENVEYNILDSITATGHTVAFDLANMLLNEDGFCVIRIGTYGGHNMELMAQLSGFNFGILYGMYRTLIVRKNSNDILIEPWMITALEYSLGPNIEHISNISVKPIHQVKNRFASYNPNHPAVHSNALIIKDHRSKMKLS